MLETFFAVPALAACLISAQPAPSASFTPVSIMPGRFEARVGEQLAVRLEGTDSAALAWNAHPIRWFAVRVAGTQENADEAPGAAAAGVGAPIAIALQHPGVTMIGAEFAVATVQLTPAQLHAALDPLVTPDERDRVLKDLPDAKPVRVRVVRGAKSLVRVLPADPKAVIPTDAQTTGSKFGSSIEIRCLLDPLESLVGGDITLRFHADYDKAARARAFAANLDTGTTQEFTANGSGIALFHMNEAGRWRVHFATAQRLPAGADADIVVYSATLTFAATRMEAPK